jgi:hypothetical protein
MLECGTQCLVLVSFVAGHVWALNIQRMEFGWHFLLSCWSRSFSVREAYTFLQLYLANCEQWTTFVHCYILKRILSLSIPFVHYLGIIVIYRNRNRRNRHQCIKLLNYFQKLDVTTSICCSRQETYLFHRGNNKDSNGDIMWYQSHFKMIKLQDYSHCSWGTKPWKHDMKHDMIYRDTDTMR